MSLETLRARLDALPDGATLPVAWLREQLDRDDGEAPGQPSGDLTLEQAGQQLGRSASTVRGWCEQGRFPGAYHLPASEKPDKRGRVRRGAWRIPSAALEAFRASLQVVPATPQPAIMAPRAAQPHGKRRRTSGDARTELGAWRRS